MDKNRILIEPYCALMLESARLEFGYALHHPGNVQEIKQLSALERSVAPSLNATLTRRLFLTWKSAVNTKIARVLAQSMRERCRISWIDWCRTVHDSRVLRRERCCKVQRLDAAITPK